MQSSDVMRASSDHGQEAKTQPPKKRKGFWRRKWWVALLVVVLVALLAFLTYGYFNTRSQLNKALSNSKTSGQDERQQILNEVSKYLALPKETPTLATVNDASKLKSQEFFKNAQNGDKVLIFSNAGRALLYRPSTHKIIDYSKVNINTGQ